MRSYVLFDVNYLGYRALYSTGTLSYHDDPTGVLYGVFREIQAAKQKFPTSRFVFCFDHGKGIREQMYSGYKETRRKKKLTDEEIHSLNGMQEQIRGLKLTYLDRAGFSNVLFHGGYEADDLIASVCLNCLREQDTAVIYSDDKDLYQLLTPNVSIYKPRTQVMYGYNQFRKEYRIKPSDWAAVKAIAGCVSDDVHGVEGVGEITALKYVRKELEITNKKFRDIESGRKLWKKNLPIVKLPLAGCKIPTLAKDTWTREKWEDLLGGFGMVSLLGSGGLPGGMDKPKPLLKV